MSKLRNTPAAPRRARNTLVASLVAVGTVAAGLLTACSSDARNPVAPEAAAKTPVMSTAPTTTQQDGNWQGNTTDIQEQLTPTQFTGLQSTFVTASSDLQSGTRVPSQKVACNTWTASSGASLAYVTPSSPTQTLQIGRIGTLTIPAGAVKAGVQISASATLGADGIAFDFQPHGYKFAKPLTFSANYQGCTLGRSTPLNMFFLNDQGGILQTMPSTDNRVGGTIKALTDHFSHYMVAWT